MVLPQKFPSFSNTSFCCCFHVNDSPLHALVLGNSLMTLWYQDRTHEVHVSLRLVGWLSELLWTICPLDKTNSHVTSSIYLGVDSVSHTHMSHSQPNRWIVGAFRTMAALPPLVGGYLVRDLGTIFDYNGILGLAIAFVVPSLLYISSSSNRSIPTTIYERQGSSYPAAIMMLCMGVMAQVTVLCLLVWRG